MATVTKKIRRSKDDATEYQLEYKERSAGLLSEYRVRRGSRGTWTKWYRTQDVHQLLVNLGFNRRVPTLLNDFYFESYFGRGEIQINLRIFKVIAGSVGRNPLNTELYASLKQISPNRWVIPAAALSSNRMFIHTRDLIKENNS